MRHGLLIAAMAMAVSGRAAAPNEAAALKDPAPEIATLDPVFDCFHMNTAWGFALAGTMIDHEGNIYRYRMHGKVWAPATTQVDGAMYYRDAELRAKFVQARRTGSVDAKALTENSALIAKAAAGKLQQTDTGARDAGSSACHAYVYDGADQRYRDIELGSDGGVSDLRISNDSAAAASLLTWLKSIGVAR